MLFNCSLSVDIAEVAQLVEHNLAKVRVAGSSPVFRSFFCSPGGGIGRRARFRCEWFIAVQVRVLFRAQD